MKTIMMNEYIFDQVSKKNNKGNAHLFLKLVLLVVSFNAMSAMPVVEVPVENPITEEKRILGKILFWDEQLSSDNSVACGTCHIPSNGGTDPRFAVNPGPDNIVGTDDDVIASKGIAHYDENSQPIDDPVFGFQPQVTGRSTPSFINAMYAPDLFWDGRATSQFNDPQNPDDIIIASGGALESQSLAPILSTVEMARENRDWDVVIAKLISITPLALARSLPEDMKDALAVNNTYPKLFNQAFGDETITAARIAMAIATYERTLVSDQTPWDLYMEGDLTAMTADQIAGWELFNNGDGNNGGGMGGGMGNGDGPNCAMCHTPPLFTDNKFYNIGLRPADEDAGRMDVTNDPQDFGRFKTPGLRNIGLKSAMMHVGWITDSMDAIDFYNAGTADVTSNHVQFTANQSGLPTDNPNAPMSPPYTMAAIAVNSEADQAKIADFMSNALTDPRVAEQAFPFDRPTLNSEIITPVNSGLNGAWYNTDTSGQGILLEVLPASNKAFFAWFTYDTQLQEDDSSIQIGAAGQRWLTGIGDIDMQNRSITFDVAVTSDGLFDSTREVTVTEEGTVGTVVIKFTNCSTATVQYNLYNGSLQNTFPMGRISSENNDLCEKLSLQPVVVPAKTAQITQETILTDGEFDINSGLNGAWYNQDSSGQGILLEVLPNSKRLFMAWFTYDTQLPSPEIQSEVGYSGHKWLTGLGNYSLGSTSLEIDINITSDGLFDQTRPVQVSEAGSYGSVTLSFNDCSNAQINYSFLNGLLSGSIPLIRISGDNVALCQQLSQELNTLNSAE